MKFTREQIAKALKLYVITDRSWLKEDETLLSVCEKVIQNGATFLQLREKELGAEETRKEAIELQKLCRQCGNRVGNGRGRCTCRSVRH